MSDIQYTQIKREHCKAVAELIRVCFPTMPSEEQYQQDELEEMAEYFPEGCIVALDGDQPIGFGIGIFVDADFDDFPQFEDELLYDEEDETNHTIDGAYYYGSDIGVHPDYRGRSISRQIYECRKDVIRKYGKLGFIAAAVLPGYKTHKESLPIDEYLSGVVDGTYFDPTLSVQLRNGFKYIRPLKDFFEYPDSDNWSALIFWENDQLS